MPCRDDYAPIYGEEGDGKAVRLLCRVMRFLQQRHPRDREELLDQYPGLKAWTAQHEKEDRERLRSRQRDLADARMRKSALKKLTAKERQSLGLSRYERG